MVSCKYLILSTSQNKSLLKKALFREMLKMRQLQCTIAENEHHNLSVWKRNQILRTLRKVSLLTQSEGTGSLMLKTLHRIRISPSKAQFSSAILIREERDASTTDGTVTR